MYNYVARTGGRYVIYQGRDDAQKHPESKDLWFFAPEKLFGEYSGFNNAYYTAQEAEVSAEEYDEGFQPLRARFLEILRDEEVKERRSQLRLVKVS